MKQFLKHSSVSTLALFTLLVIIVGGCQTSNDARNEVPITTKSEAARQLYVDGRSMSENLRVNEARDLFTRAIGLDDEFALAYLSRALVARTGMEFQRDLKAAIDNSSHVSEGEQMIIKAWDANSKNNPAGAIQILDQLAEKFPADKRTHWYAGLAYAGTEETEKAIDQFNKALAVDKDFVPAHNNLGYAYRTMKNYDKAKDAFENYIRLRPDEPNPYDSMADLLTKMGRHQEAIDNYKKALELDPTFTASQRNIGTNMAFMGMFNEARDAYKKSMEKQTDPSDIIANQQLIAISYLYEGKFVEANKEFDKALAMAIHSKIPDATANAHLNICAISIETGDIEKAKKNLGECRSVVTTSNLLPSSRESFEKRSMAVSAIILAKQKRFDEALALAEDLRVMIVGGTNQKELENYRAVLGRVHFEKGDFVNAIEHLNRANQENPRILYLQAQAESQLGNTTRSEELMRTVAGWNENSLDYALVRPKALLAAAK